MNTEYTQNVTLSGFKPVKDQLKKRSLLAITLEITARCNNNCRHCYVNLPKDDEKAIAKEMTFDKIRQIIDEAVSLGALWCNFTGGEPLLRDDFNELYLYAKKSGLLTSVLTNATLITGSSIKLFKKYPPKNLEVSVYGVSLKTYERVSCVKGSFDKFSNGINMLLENKIPISLKAPALKSNYQEYGKLIDFCRKHSRQGYVRFDPITTLRTDDNDARNRLIEQERLQADKIHHILNQYFPPDFKNEIFNKKCLSPQSDRTNEKKFQCNAGKNSCEVGYDAMVYPCAMYPDPKIGYDLLKGNLRDAWHHFFPKILSHHFKNIEYPQRCGTCKRIDDCLWCPGLDYLEKKGSAKNSDYICDIIKEL